MKKNLLSPLRGLSVLSILIFFVLTKGASQIVDKKLWMPNGVVQSIAKHGDMVYVGGEFSQVSTPASNAALLDAANGSVVNSFAFPDFTVSSAIPDTRGGFFISGSFYHVGTASRIGLAHLKTDGSVSGFNPMFPIGGHASTRKVLAATADRVFVSVLSTIFCMDHDGNILWTQQTNGAILECLVKNNTLYMAGQFLTVGAVPRKRLAAIDIPTGSLLDWNTENSLAGYSNFYSLSTSDTELFVTNRVSNVYNTVAVDLSSGLLGAWSTKTIKSKTLIHNGKLYSSGSNGLIILDVVTKNVLPNPTSFTASSISKIVSDGNTIYVAGSQLRDANGEALSEVISFNATTYDLLPFKSGIMRPFDIPDAQFSTLAAGGGRVLIGGLFSGINAKNRINLYAYNAVTGELADFAPDMDGSVINQYATATKLYIHGYFSQINGQDRQAGIASFDLPSGTLTTWNPAIEGVVDILKGDTDRIYLGGFFSMVDGTFRNGAVSFDASTGSLSSWSPEGFNVVSDLDVNETSVAIAGFDLNNSAIRKIFIVDNVTGLPLLTPIPHDGEISDMAISNEKLYVIGDFASIGGVDREQAACVDLTNGSITNWVPDIAELSPAGGKIGVHGGTVYVASRHFIDGGSTAFVAALDKITAQPTNWEVQAKHNRYWLWHGVFALMVTQDAVYLGGKFDFIGNEPMVNLAVVSPDKSNVITGKVFYDDNNNGVQDAGETGVPNILMEVEPGSVFFPTDANGNYRAFATVGSYTIKPVSTAYTISIAPAERNLSFSSDLELSSGNDFALQVEHGVRDMQLTLTNSTAARPGFNVKYVLTYKNLGTIANSGVVKLTLDNNFEYISSTPSATVNGDQLTWNYNVLGPGNSSSIRLNLKLPPDVNLIGRELISTASVLPAESDANEADNIFELNQLVTGSFDPNDKLVTPTGYGSQGFIPQNTDELLYTIRFQNMGTDTAFNIVVKDVIDASLDVSSFTMVSASHPYTFTIENGEATWNFNNVLLPHVGVNEPGSHGYITFSIDLKENLPIGTVIQNNANIFFDFNPPVLTNTVVNTIKNPPYIPVSIIASDVIGKFNAEVLVPVRVSSFNSVIASQFSVNWDPAIASYIGVEGLNPVLSGNDFGTSQVSNGQLGFAWSSADLSSISLPDSSALFSIRFSLAGNYGDTTLVNISDLPVSAEVVNGDYQSVPIERSMGLLIIDPSVAAQGEVLYTNDEPIQNVTIDVTGSALLSAATSAQGSFLIDLKPGGPTDSYTFTPSKSVDSSPTNGIDVADAAAIHRHILLVDPFTSPLQTIAADVNSSQSVSVLDITLVKAMVLGLNTNFPNSALWTFVPSDHSFASITNPFPYPQSTTVSASQLETTTLNYIGVKRGDVNSSRDNSQSTRKSDTPLTFDILQEKIFSETEDERIVEIHIRAKHFAEIAAYQFTMSWDTHKLEFIEVKNKNIESTFGENRAAEGKLTVMWYDETGGAINLEDRDQLFVLKFRSIGEGNYRDLRVTDEITAAKAFDKKLRQVNHIVSYSELTIEDYKDGFLAYPNPFHDGLSIEFYSPVQEEVGIEITDITGRSMHRETNQAAKGKNVVQWRGVERTGAYVVSVKTSLGIVRIKVIKY